MWRENIMEVLIDYSKQIETIEKNFGLSFYPQEFELINYKDMLGYMTYLGFINHYPHWSFGKTYDKLKNNLDVMPFEIIINSNPCIAYLLKNNNLITQILIIAHVYAHNDFFKNNIFFKKNTNAKNAIQMFKNHARRVNNYIKQFGEENVEKILDVAHAIKYYFEEGFLLDFIIQNVKLEEWKIDLLQIVAEQSRYFYPQIETKIINEGWASFWHYKTLKELNLSADKYLGFISLHNNIISSRFDVLNPYYIGFKIWDEIYKHEGVKKMLAIREFNKDSSFIRDYLSPALAKELGLYSYIEDNKIKLITNTYRDYESVQNILINNMGLNNVPKIEVIEYTNNKFLISHISDGRELDLFYATETLKHLNFLLEKEIILLTHFSGVKRQIICDKQQKVHVKNLKFD
ncbi:hypothetical protein AN641_01775 [Candidatus Epulonipiscioides gigas]|nr:hypothetical protein AN641_01775 [Epulopiscium sp. SCG-C07WGA-EpuloA2]